MSARRDFNCDVVIIGAGAAGLSAAAELSRGGLRVTVLEARDRIGGRVHTLHDPACPHPVELGAEFVHGRPEEIFRILRSANLLACDADGEHWYLQGKRLRQLPHAWEDIGEVLERLAKEFPKGTKKDQSYGEFIARKSGRFKRPQREMATLFVEGFNAAPADRVSANWLADGQRAEELGGAEEQFRLPGGYDQIVQHLADGCDVDRCLVRLRQTAKSVQWAGQRAVVHTDDSTATTCRAVLVTLPLGVLQSGAVAFDGPLPKWKDDAIGALGFGSVVKVVLKFNDAFWEGRALPSMGRGKDLSGMAFLHSRGESFPTWWTWLPLRAATLTGWAGGPAADALAGRPEQEIHAEAVASLARYFGMKPADLGRSIERRWVADWHSDPHALGAYSYVPAGASGAVAKLAAPVDDVLFFAGEATEPAGSSGTVAGAIASGRRGAREIIGAFGRR